MTKLTFKLVRAARKFGGDRYEHNWEGNLNDKVVVYVPQTISRKLGEPVKVIDITFEPKGIEDEILHIQG